MRNNSISSEFGVRSSERCALLVGLLAMFLLGGCTTKREIKNVYSLGKNVICFGDSLTFGYGTNKGEDYPTTLAKMLPVPVINAGIDGDTTVEALGRLKADVLDREPLLVIVEFCGNDFMRKITLDTTVAHIRNMVDQAHAHGAMVAIVDISAGLFLRDYRLAFEALAREKQAIFVPAVLTGIITNPQMKSDFLHPNRLGYNIIAQRVYRAVLPAINQNIIAKQFNKVSFTQRYSLSKE